MIDLSSKTIAVLGAGRSGVAAARLACRCGGEVTIYDSGEISSVPEGCQSASKTTLDDARKVVADLVILSPGIPTRSDWVQAFLENGGTLWGEIELAFRCFSGCIIAITGTNGKTTTTELVRDLVETTGKSCLACGNYGIPFSEVVMSGNCPGVVALELSSFQLESIIDFKPDAVVWLNFSADHMDRYETLEEYREAKLRIFENISADTPVVARKGELLPKVGKLIEFSSTVDTEWSLQGDVLCHRGQEFIALSDTRLRGLHNAENLLAACAVVEGLTPNAAKEKLKKYSPPEHRCELVAIIDGVEYLNDSKATNLHALESALRSQTRPTILLAGGKQKGLDYQPLASLLKDKVKKLITFGEIGPALSVTFFDVVPCETVDELDEAVALATQAASPGDTVLLSPGTSSFDQFNGYEERGHFFKKAVPRLTRSQ